WFSGVLLIIILYCIWVQVKGLKQRLDNHVLQNYWSIWIEIDKWFVANSELKPFFYHGKDTDAETSSEIRTKLESAAEMFLECFSNIYLQRNVIPSDEEQCIRACMNDM